jgi:hypothetical protein
VQGIHYEQSYCPSVKPTTLRVNLAIAAMLRAYIGMIDIKNAFQTTQASLTSKASYSSMPPFYLQWLLQQDGFDYAKEDGPYVRQLFAYLQGKKEASHKFYIFLASVFKSYGLLPATVDQGFFIKIFDNQDFLYVLVKTDDLLIITTTEQRFDDFSKFLTTRFELSIQKGAVLNFCSMRIIQSSEGISLDQSEFIMDMLRDHFADCNKVKGVNTPIRHDKEFQLELLNAAPLNPAQYKDCAQQYKGGYRHLIGRLIYTTMTRFDAQYSIQRLSEYNHSPTAPSFEAVHRIYRYFANDPHRPLFFPQSKIDGKSLITVKLTPDRSESFELDNGVNIFSDATLADDIATRRSYLCSMITLNGVCVSMKVTKTDTVHPTTTDSETHAAFLGVHRAQPVVELIANMGVEIHVQ